MGLATDPYAATLVAMNFVGPGSYSQGGEQAKARLVAKDQHFNIGFCPQCHKSVKDKHGVRLVGKQTSCLQSYMLGTCDKFIEELVVLSRGCFGLL